MRRATTGGPPTPSNATPQHHQHQPLQRRRRGPTRPPPPPPPLPLSQSVSNWSTVAANWPPIPNLLNDNDRAWLSSSHGGSAHRYLLSTSPSRPPITRYAPTSMTSTSSNGATSTSMAPSLSSLLQSSSSFLAPTTHTPPFSANASSVMMNDPLQLPSASSSPLKATQLAIPVSTLPSTSASVGYGSPPSRVDNTYFDTDTAPSRLPPPVGTHFTTSGSRLPTPTLPSANATAESPYNSPYPTSTHDDGHATENDIHDPLNLTSELQRHYQLQHDRQQQSSSINSDHGEYSRRWDSPSKPDADGGQSAYLVHRRLRRWFAIWRRHLHQLRQRQHWINRLRDGLIKALSHWQYRTMATVIREWHRGIKSRRARLVIAIVANEHRHIQHIFHRWYELMRQRRMTQNALDHWQRYHQHTTFMAWSRYVITQREHRNQINHGAMTWHSQRLTTAALRHWALLSLQSRREHALLQLADEHRPRLRLRSTIDRWLMNVSSSSVHGSGSQRVRARIAARQWRRQSIIHVILQWQMRVQQSIADRTRQQMAKRFSGRRISRLAFRSWSRYAHEMALRARHERMVHQRVQLRQLTLVWKTWQQRLHESEEINDAKINHMGQAKLYSWWSRWQQACRYRQLQLTKLENALLIGRHASLRVCYQQWYRSYEVELARVRQQLDHATKQHRRQSLSHAIRHMNIIAQSGRRSKADQSNAISQYNHRLTQLVLLQWQQSLHRRQIARRVLSRLVGMATMPDQRRVVNQWSWYIQTRREQRIRQQRDYDIGEQIAESHRLRTVSQCLRGMMSLMTYYQGLRQVEHEIADRQSSQTLVEYWNEWRAARTLQPRLIAFRVRQRIIWQQAIMGHMYGVLLTKRLSHAAQHVTTMNNRRTVHESLLRWYAALYWKRRLAGGNERAFKHQPIASLKTHFKAWHRYARYQTRISAAIQHTEKRRHDGTLTFVWQLWRHRLDTLRWYRSAYQIATNHQLTTIQRQAWLRWYKEYK
jgi:hypothetical protein